MNTSNKVARIDQRSTKPPDLAGFLLLDTPAADILDLGLTAIVETEKQDLTVEGVKRGGRDELFHRVNGF